MRCHGSTQLLYVGLYLEALGEARARFYIEQAASEEFGGVGGYMRSVAKVHMQVRQWTGSASPKPK